MKNSQNINDEHALILDYIYGELSLAEKTAFEQRLKTDVNFKSLYATQMEFNEVINRGMKPKVDEERVRGVRWSLQKRLRRKANKKRFIFVNLWSSQIGFKTQLASMLLTFMLGFFIAGNQESNRFLNLNNAMNSSNPLSLIQDGDYEIVDLNLGQINADNGDLKVSFSLASETEINTNLNHPKFQNLLVKTMNDNVSDSIRLDLIELLKDQIDSNQVRKALIDRLLNDSNPGVRIVAAETLAKLSYEKSIRIALRQALQNDINPGVRVEVFQALIRHLDDQKTVDMFREYVQQDANQYIRSQAQLLLKQQGKSKRI